MSDGCAFYKSMFDELYQQIQNEGFSNVDRIREAIDLLDEFNQFIDIEVRKTGVTTDTAATYKRTNHAIALKLDELLRAKNS